MGGEGGLVGWLVVIFRGQLNFLEDFQRSAQFLRRTAPFLEMSRLIFGKYIHLSIS